MRMCNDRVLIELEPESNVTAGGLFKPEGTNEHVFRIGKVLKVGPGKRNVKTGLPLPMRCKPGMRVLFVKFVATHTQSARDIQAIVGENKAIIKDYDALLELPEDVDISVIGQ